MVEVLVAVAVFTVILVMVIRIDQVGRDAFVKNQANSESYRMAMLGVQHIEAQLRGAKVDPAAGDVQPSRVSYRVPKMKDGRPEVSASGEILYSPDKRTIQLKSDGSGDLVSIEGTRVRTLSRLGPTGSTRFTWAGPGLLTVELVVEHEEKGRGTTALRRSNYQVREDFFLPNSL